MNCRRQHADILFRGYRQRQLANHLTGMARHDRAAENFACLLVVMNSPKACGFTVKYGAIDFTQRLRNCRHVEACSTRVFFMETDVSDFRVGIRAPRNHQIGHFAPRKE